MAEISLYRKYRPSNFDNLVGQDHVKQTLVNAILSGNISHAYLFTGPRGTGKTSTARLIAKALICQNLQNGFEPCDVCELCSEINDGRLIDLIEIDAASNRGIDEVRDLKEKIGFAPTRAKCKVYIIDEVHMMTKEAFNALLKTLEEPPAHVYFVLATTEIHKIPETIISRCQRFDFRRINEKALMARLAYIAQKEAIAADEQALLAISKYADGGLRDAIGLLEQLTVDKKLSFSHVQDILGISDTNLLQAFYTALMNKNTKEALKIIHELHDQGSDLRQFSQELLNLFREEMLKNVMENQQELTGQLIKLIGIFQEAQHKLETSIPQLSLEIAVIQSTGAVKEKVQMVEERLPVEKPPTIERKIAPESQVVRGGNFDLNTLLDSWPRVTERVKTPSLRMSLRHAVPIKVEEHRITLEFETNFHKSKIEESAYKNELEESIKEVLNQPVKVFTSLKSLDLKPVMEEEKTKVVDDALNIFGGELVE